MFRVFRLLQLKPVEIQHTEDRGANRLPALGAEPIFDDNALTVALGAEWRSDDNRGATPYLKAVRNSANWSDSFEADEPEVLSVTQFSLGLVSSL